jgi:hypothetical protein
MARGWESKAVEAQQQEALQRLPKGPAPGAKDLATRERRRTLELTRTRLVNDLSRASVLAHRQMLESSIAELDRQLADLGSVSGSEW